MRFDPFELDRAVAQAARAEQRHRRVARADPARARELPSWFVGVREATGKSTFDEIASLTASDPLRAPLRRWVHRLALTRIAQPFVERLDDAWREPTAGVDSLGKEPWTVREGVARAIAEPHDERRALWIDAIAGTSPPLALAARDLLGALHEIRLRLAAHPDERVDSRVDPAITTKSANAFLDATDALVDVASGTARSWSQLIGTVVGRDVPGDWPRRPGARWMADLFGGTPLLEGLDLDPGTFTPTLGATSFARALARFGATYRRAAAPANAPFVLAHDATELEPLRRGVLFAMLVLEPSFLHRHVGLSRARAADAIRMLARAAIVHLRLEATSALTTDSPLAATNTHIDDAIARAVGFEPPRSLTFVLPRPHRFASARFVAALIASDDRNRLVDRFDDDWFRNPRALEWLRDQDGSILLDGVSAAQDESAMNDAVTRAVSRLASDLEDAAA